MPKLETLELEITQSSKVSSRGIKPLATALGLLAEASNKVQNLGAVASGLKQLAEGGNGLKESAAGIRSVANAMKKLSETLSSAPGSVTGLQRIAEAMSKISEAAGGLSGTASDIREIKSASKAAAPTAAANAKAAKKQSLTYMFSEQEGISQDKYRQLTDTLFSAESAGSIKDVVENFKELNRIMNEATPEEYARAIDRVKAALLSGDPQEIARYIKELGAVSKRLPSNYSNVAAGAEAEAAATVDPEDAAEPTEEIGRAADVSTEKLERMKAVLASIQSESGASGVADSLKEMSRIMDETTPEQYAAALERVRAALESGNSEEITAAIKDLNKAISNLPPEADKAAAGVRKMKVEMWKIPWGDFKKRIKESVGGLSQLFASFKRIAMYRALRTAIKMITQGFATGVKHLYAWADLVGNSFKGSMDSLATSANYLKNSLGAMVSPIIDALAPAVEILVEKFVELINVVNQFLATVTGASSWRRAVRQQKEYEENTNDAAAAQKRLNHQLMAFDELNNITLNNPSGRGSGNKDNEIDDKSFVVEELPDWAKDIKDEIDKGNWYEAGSLLANKINGLIDNWDAAEWGKKLGEKISNGLNFYNGLMDNTNWKGLGGKVADWLDAVIENVPGEDLGHAIVAKFNAAIGFLAGFTGNFDWSAAGTWLADVLIGAITGINWKNAGELVGNLAKGLLNMIEAAFNELASNSGKILSIIGDFFSGLWGEDGSGLLSVVKIGGLITAFKILFSNALDDKKLGTSVTSKMGNKFAEWAEAAGMSKLSLAATILVTIKAATELVGWANKVKAKGFSEGTLEYFGIDNRNSVFINIAPQMNDVKSAIEQAFSADPANLPFFKKVLQIVSAFAKVMGIDISGIVDTGTSTKKGKSSKGGANSGGPENWGTGMKTAIDGITESAKKADKQISVLGPSAGNKRSFLASIGEYVGKVMKVGTEATKSKNSINKLPTSKKFKFIDVSDGLGKAANYASAFVKYESKFKEKYTFTVDASELGDAASDAQKLYQNLNNINSKSWKVQVTGDMKLKMVSERGNTMYFVQPEANGGFPATGQLFIANEAGPELIGTVNGHTAVSSNQEITGIANAVYETGEDEAALLREQNQLLRQLLAKQTTVSLAPNVAAGRWVAQASNAYRKATGG